jgi:hypothetical protein
MPRSSAFALSIVNRPALSGRIAPQHLIRSAFALHIILFVEDLCTIDPIAVHGQGLLGTTVVDLVQLDELERAIDGLKQAVRAMRYDIAFEAQMTPVEGHRHFECGLVAPNN